MAKTPFFQVLKRQIGIDVKHTLFHWSAVPLIQEGVEAEIKTEQNFLLQSFDETEC